MPKGKVSAQVAHASVEAVLRSLKDKIMEWKEDGSKKVVLKVEGLKELMEYKEMARKAGLQTAIIEDAGRTFFTEPTITCLAIGPDEDKKIDKITGKLKIL